MEETEITNPLINPCKCNGSLKYIHLNCLQLWSTSKAKIRKHERITLFAYKDFYCDLCKYKYPDNISYKGEIYPLNNIPKHKKYIMLESIHREEQEYKHVFIFDLAEKDSFSFGRELVSDFKLPEDSVSHKQATFYFKNGNCFLIDDDSKFGTHALIRSEMMILPNHPLAIQKGNCLINLNLRKTFVAFISCYSNAFFRNMTYNDQIEKEFLKNKKDFETVKVIDCDDKETKEINSKNNKTASYKTRNSMKNEIEITNAYLIMDTILRNQSCLNNSDNIETRYNREGLFTRE